MTPSVAAEGILQRLRANGGRVTPTRRALVEALLAGQGHGHRTADELAQAVHAAHPEVHRSTVYRTLEALEAAGVVEHVHMGHGPSVFHLAEARHQHLVCDACGTVVEVPDAVFDELRDVIRRTYGFEVSPGHFALPGLCAACTRVTRNPPQ